MVDLFGRMNLTEIMNQVVTRMKMTKKMKRISKMRMMIRTKKSLKRMTRKISRRIKTRNNMCQYYQMKISQNNVLIVLALIFLWLVMSGRASGYATPMCCGGA